MKKRSKQSKLDKILLEYVKEKESYYRKKLKSGYPLKDIIQESMEHNELPILKCLILQEFPTHRSFLFKHIMIQ